MIIKSKEMKDEKKIFREPSTYCNIMEGRPCRAASFDWNFWQVAITGPAERGGIVYERILFERMIKELNFTIYTSKKQETRNLPKRNFIKELKKCEYGIEWV